MIGRSTSVVAGEAGTVVPTWVHRNGRSESPHLRRVAEQLDEPRLLGRLVAAALRLDPDLAAQRDGVDRPARRRSVMRSRSISVGTAAYGSARASTTSKPSELMASPRRRAVGPAPARRRRTRRARRAPPRRRRSRATAGAAGRPARSRRRSGTRKHSARAAGAVGAHEERLDVGQQRGQAGVGGDELVPRVERQQRLGGAGRARVERGDPLERRVHEEEGHADRDLQRVPLAGRQLRSRGRRGSGRARRGSGSPPAPSGVNSR